MGHPAAPGKILHDVIARHPRRQVMAFFVRERAQLSIASRVVF